MNAPRFACIVLLALMSSAHTTLAQTPAVADADDPYLWLEDVGGEKSLAWVRARNALAEKEFAANSRYEPLRAKLLAILNSQERIPYVTRMGDHVYNFWRDAANPRGLWRRTTLAEYRKPQPAWEVVIDLDAVAAADKENWVWKQASCLRPDRPGEPYRRCLIALSRGGADATVVREFDLQDKRFVSDGFNLPVEAKQDVDWKDLDMVWVASDFGPGSMTTSGYPRIVKQWRRGTPLAAARTVFEGKDSDVGVEAYSERESGQRRDWVRRYIEFWNTENYVEVDGRLARLEVPNDASISTFKDWLLIRTRTPWNSGGTTFPAGALLATRFDAFMKGERKFDVLYAPTARSSLDEIRTTRSAVLVSELDNVRPRLWELQHDGTQWQRRRVPLPEQG